MLAPEIARLLRPGGWFYVSSVIRGPRGFWFYRGKPPAPERWQLDPTHMREYESEEHFRSAVSHPELELDVVRSSQLKFGLTDFILRMASLARIVKRERLPVLYLQLPAWVRGHQEIENCLHWVRDVTYQEDKSLVRTGNAPRVMASLRSLAVNVQVLGFAAAVRDGRLRFGGGRGVAVVAERGFGDDPGL